MNVNLNPAPGPQTVNPYSGKTAQQAFSTAVSGNAQQASKVKLWAIRIFSDIASVLTQPAVLLTTSGALMIAATFMPKPNLAVGIIAMAVNLLGTTLFSLGLYATSTGKLNELSKYHAAKAELAKTEINHRNAQFAGQGQRVGFFG